MTSTRRASDPGSSVSDEPVPLSVTERTIVGHYRAFSPWFPSFRIVWREGRLLLTALGGVEAPSSEEGLVELESGTFRIGRTCGFPSSW